MNVPSKSRLRLAVICLVGAFTATAAGIYLWTVHREHLAGLALYALALGCVLVHVLGHRDGSHKREASVPPANDYKRLG